MIRSRSNPKFCPECGGENSENANFCENCGASLEIVESGNETQEKIDIQTVILRDNSNMDSLNLTPAESLMILDHKRYSQKILLIELLKVTLIDLVFKNVFKLDIQEVESITGRIVKETRLQEGKFFNMSLKPHEEVFLEYLQSRKDSNRFKTYLGLVLHDAVQHDYVKEKLLKPLSSEGYFTLKKGFLRKKYSLSDKGVKSQQMIKRLINDGRNLENWLETDPERAKAYILIGGSNIFLTDKHNFKWFRNNSGRIGGLFSSRRVRTNTSDFYDYCWYAPFILDSGIFDISNIDDIFSDFNMSTLFDSIDSHSFDFGFNITGSDGGIFDNESGGFDNGSYDDGFDGGGFDSGSSDGGGGGD